jgi:uncharacterized membrane protein
MSDVNIAVLIFTGVGIVFIALGIPLFQGRVPPNSWYGCRTTRTLSDEKIWYAVNRVTGKDMILIGILVIISSLALFIFGRSLSSNHATVILLSLVIFATVGMVVNSFRVLKQM